MGKVVDHSSNNLAAAIEEAVQFLPKDFTPKHEHSAKCYAVLKHILHPGEYTIIEAKQSPLKSITPVRLVATNQRIIIVKPSYWALKTGRNIFSSTKYESIPYSNVVNIAIYIGMMFSTLSIHLNTAMNAGEDDVVGLKTRDAEAMFAFLEKMTAILRLQGKELSDRATESANARATQNNQGINYVDMETARRYMKYRGAKLVWLGAENPEYVAEKLDIDKNNIIKMNSNELMDENWRDPKRLEGYVLVCYTDNFSSYISHYLKQTHGITTYVLKGGLEYQMEKIRDLDKVSMSGYRS